MLLRFCLIGAIILAVGRCVGQSAVTPAPADQERQKAIALEQQADNAEAEAAWHTYLKTHPSSAEAYAHLGLLESRQEHYKEAVPLYRKALAIDSKIPGLRLNLGLALFKAGAMREALREFELLSKSETLAPADRQRLAILIGMCYYGVEEYAHAVPYLKVAAAREPQNLALRLALAHSCLWSRQYQCVLDTYHEILMLNAESAEADMLAGEALDELKDGSGAIEQFRAAVKADPKMPDVHFGLGYLLWSKHRYEEAVPEFEAELVNNPIHVQALVHLGDTQMKLSHPEAAIPLFEKVIGIDPRVELSYLDLGIVYANAGRNDDALREFKAASALAPNDVDIHWRLGRLYRAMGNKEKAKAELDEVKRITVAADTALIDKRNPHPVPALHTLIQTPAPQGRE